MVEEREDLGRDFVVLREKLKIDQVEPGVRMLERELAIQNVGRGDKREFLLVLEDFLPGLAVKDGADEELTYLPTKMMEAEIQGDSEDLYKFIEELAGDAFTETTRLLWILFPEAVKPGETRIVRLLFEDREEGSDWKFIAHPWFKVDVRKRQDDHDTFVEIRAPSEGVLFIESGVGMPPKGKEETPAGVKQKVLPRFLQVRVPGGHEGATFRYHMRPNASERAVLWASLILLTLVPVVLLLLAWPGWIHLSGTDNSSGETVGTLGITGILGIIAFVKPTWINRAWYFVPTAAFLLLLVLSLK